MTEILNSAGLEEDLIFRNDTSYILSLIGRRVTIETTNKKSHTGVVYVIDPIFKTVVLVVETETPEVTIILHHAIKSVTAVSEEIVNTDFTSFPQRIEDWNSDENRRRREHLKKWLSSMHFEVEEMPDGVLKVGEYLSISCPYTTEDCFSDNTVILERIRTLILQMPNDVCL